MCNWCFVFLYNSYSRNFVHKPVVGPGSEFLFRIRIHQNNSDPFCYGSTTLLNRIIYFKSLTFICVYDVASGKLYVFLNWKNAVYTSMYLLS